MKNEAFYIYILTGPTGVGKTRLSLQLASRWNMEIVSADSMQVYRQLSIGTAKPKQEELSGKAYHLIDCVDIDEKYDLARFIHDADEVITRFKREGIKLLVVGGTGLYIKGLLEGVFPTKVNKTIREELHARVDAGELPQLYSELTRIDPSAASKIKAKDRQRIVRALEVYMATGMPISVHQEMSRTTGYRYPHKLVVVTRDRREIYEQIERRIEEMFSRGFIEEVKHILQSGYSKTLHPLKALGYREVIRYLDGMWSLEKVKEETKKSTRRYAKRQLTWFRAMDQAVWLNISGMSEEEALNGIAHAFFGDL